MRKLACLATFLVFFPSLAQAAVTEENFMLDTTADLVALCGVSADDPNADAAIHMCHGYLTGLMHFHIVVGRVLEGNVFCMEEAQRPTRDQAVAMLVEWSRANPQYDSTEAVDGVLQWAHETYPCSE